MSAVKWDENAEAFLKDADAMEKIAGANLLLAIWARQLETSDVGNPALLFIREMQIAGQEITMLVALSSHKAAAERMKYVLESASYYTYFRTQPSELERLLSDSAYFVSMQDIIEYHKQYSVNFMGMQERLGLVSQFNEWHRKTTAVVHGELPGAWIDHTSIVSIRPIKYRQDATITLFAECVDLVNKLLLCTVGLLLGGKFSSATKERLLSGFSSEQKKALGLDAP